MWQRFLAFVQVRSKRSGSSWWSVKNCFVGFRNKTIPRSKQDTNQQCKRKIVGQTPTRPWWKRSPSFWTSETQDNNTNIKLKKRPNKKTKATALPSKPPITLVNNNNHQPPESQSYNTYRRRYNISATPPPSLILPHSIIKANDIISSW